MRLWLLHPAVARRDCRDCLRHVYEHATGRRLERQGQPVPRPAGTFAPCHYGADQCPKVSPESGIELSKKNRAAYRHHLECRAVGQFPDDSIVRRNAAIIEYAVERI